MYYKSINPPQSFNYLSDASQSEAKTFFDWFLSVKDERIKLLEKAIRRTKGFESWKADLNLDSLYMLEKWLEKVAEERRMSDEEIRKEKSLLLPPFKNIQISNKALTGRTVSIAFDAGIFFGEILKANGVGLRWKLFQKKNYADNNYPVLGDFINGVIYNPRRIFEVQIAKILKKKEIDLVRLFKFWKDLIK